MTKGKPSAADLLTALGALGGEGIELHPGQSVWRGRRLELDDAGQIAWAPKGARDTLRPTLMVTSRNAGGVDVVLVAMLLVGERAQLSAQWKREMAEVCGFSPEQAQTRVKVLRAPEQNGTRA